MANISNFFSALLRKLETGPKYFRDLDTVTV